MLGYVEGERCDCTPYGFKCCRAKGHNVTIWPCMSIVVRDGQKYCVFLYQDGKEWVKIEDMKDEYYPNDIIK